MHQTARSCGFHLVTQMMDCRRASIRQNPRKGIGLDVWRRDDELLGMPAQRRISALPGRPDIPSRLSRAID